LGAGTQALLGGADQTVYTQEGWPQSMYDDWWLLYYGRKAVYVGAKSTLASITAKQNLLRKLLLIL